MLNFNQCTRFQLTDVLEALAYKIAQYEHPNWYSIDEDTVYQILKCEGLDVVKELYEDKQYSD